MLSIDAEFESGVTMYAFVETEEDAIDALGDMANEMGEDPVEVRKDNKPWDWQNDDDEPLNAGHPYQSVTIADMISDSNVMVL